MGGNGTRAGVGMQGTGLAPWHVLSLPGPACLSLPQPASREPELRPSLATGGRQEWNVLLP